MQFVLWPLDVSRLVICEAKLQIFYSGSEDGGCIRPETIVHGVITKKKTIVVLGVVKI
jgi:hypothetical protein